jgi:hypothetical protein
MNICKHQILRLIDPMVRPECVKCHIALEENQKCYGFSMIWTDITIDELRRMNEITLALQEEKEAVRQVTSTKSMPQM